MMVRILFAVLCSTLLAQAGPFSAEKGRFFLTHTKVEMAESVPIEALTLHTDEERFTFIPPLDAVINTDPVKKEVWMSFRDERCVIVIKPTELSPDMTSPAAWVQLRERVQSRFPESQVSPALPCCNSSAAGGCTFTLRRTTVYKTKLVTSLSFVPYADGVLEVSMTTSDARASTGQFTVNSLLNCLRVEKATPLVPTPGPTLTPAPSPTPEPDKAEHLAEPSAILTQRN
jgi:hypothetical protein